MKTVQIPITNDTILENTEVFTAVLQAMDASVVEITSGNATISIMDDDEVTIGLEQTEFTVDEGDVVEVCAILIDGTLEREVTIILETGYGAAFSGDYAPVTPTDGTTISSGDFMYMEHFVDLTFNSGVNRMCVNITIEDNPAFEGIETFGVTITTLDEDTILNPDNGRVVIVDSDELTIGFEIGSYTIPESDGPLEVCLTVTSGNSIETVLPTITIRYDDIEAVGGVDYLENSAALMFGIGDTRVCFSITIIDDDLLEVLEETLTLVIQLSTSDPDVFALIQRITVEPNSALVTIIDDTTQEVQFQFINFTYLTIEGEGVEVQIQRQGSISAPVVLTLTPTMYTGGGPHVPATAGEDFDATPINITFPASTDPEETVTVVIGVIEDSINEANEVFAVQLDLLSSESMILADLMAQNSTLITITDDDPISIGFTVPEFTVEESGSVYSVQIVKENDQRSEQTFELVITADNSPGFPNQAVLGEDYVLPTTNSSSFVLPFPPGLQEVSFDIDIISDNTTEGIEAFRLQVAASAASPLFTLGQDPVTDGFITDIEQSVMCFREDSCGGNFTAEAAEDCCKGEGVSFMTVFNQVCQPCVVFGWINGSVFSGDEQGPSYSLLVGNIKGTLGRPLSLSVEDFANSAELNSDYTVNTRTVMFDSQQEEVVVSLPIDNIALEEEETFQLVLRNNDGSTLSPTADNEFFIDTIDVTIVDNEVVTIQLTEEDYSVRESDLVVPVLLQRNLRIATPVTVRVTPMTCDSSNVSCGVGDPAEVLPDDRRDFNTDALMVTFEPSLLSSEDMPANVNIIDDAINEAEEFFVVTIEIVNSVDPARVIVQRRSSLCIIGDNDPISIGFERSEYRFNETEGIFDDIRLIKEDGRISEQEIEFSVVASPAGLPTFSDATLYEDYVIGLVQVIVDSFTPVEQQKEIPIQVFDDDALEGSEVFRLAVSNTGNTALFEPGENQDTLVYIDDDDVIVVGFTVELVSVLEDSQFVELCLSITTPSDPSILTFDFFLDVETQAGTAGANDFEAITFANDPLSAFSDTNPLQCFNITIFDDALPEGTESFTVVASSPLGSGLTVTPDTVTVEIVDDDPFPLLNVTLVNDTVIADPLMTVPIFESTTQQQDHLCYEIHGSAGDYFNLVSDQCTTVNAHYTAVNQHPQVNIIGAIAVRAVDNANECQNVQVNVENCTASIGDVPVDVSPQGVSINGIGVRRFRNRVRISVPNCNETSLVMWAFCTIAALTDPISDEDFFQEAIHFVIARGLNLNERSHGLLGQFWNVPISVEPFTGQTRDGDAACDNTLVVSVSHPDDTTRSFVACREPFTWDLQRVTCLYAGNRQGGSVYEFESPNDPVIQGTYMDYLVSDAFATNFRFSRFEDSKCN